MIMTIKAIRLTQHNIIINNIIRNGEIVGRHTVDRKVRQTDIVAFN